MEVLYSQSKYEEIEFEAEKVIIGIGSNESVKKENCRDLLKSFGDKPEYFGFVADIFYNKVYTCPIIGYVEEIRTFISWSQQYFMDFRNYILIFTQRNQNTQAYGATVITKNDIIFTHIDREGTVFKEIYPLIKSKLT